jgi:hypothetical protein
VTSKKHTAAAAWVRGADNIAVGICFDCFSTWLQVLTDKLLDGLFIAGGTGCLEDFDQKIMGNGIHRRYSLKG